jgi:hypothetical protein
VVGVESREASRETWIDMVMIGGSECLCVVGRF